MLALIAGLLASKACGAGTLSFSPTAANFGDVAVGTSKSISVTITNTGTSSVALSKETPPLVNMYSVSELSLPTTLAAGSHVTVTIKFTPPAAGTFSGRVVFASNATNSLVSYTLLGVGTPGALTITPGTANFGSVPIGTSVSQSEQLKNTSSKAMTLTGVTKNAGSEFKLCNLSFPITLAAGQTLNCTLSFTATSLGSASGSVTFADTPAGSATVALTATGVADSRTISASPAGLNFGSVMAGKSETLAVKIENTGNSSLTVSGLSVLGASITTNGGVSGATIAPGQSATLDVTFAPTKAEMLSGSVKITSTAANSPTTIALTGAGVASGSSGSHSVSLDWTASTSSGIVGYNVYRATLPGTAYSKITSALVTGTNYIDRSVAAGESYTYEVTVVNTAGEESARSTPASAVIP